MTLQPFSDQQLNFFKFSSLVLNEFPKALRQTFKAMWDNNFGHRPGFQLWDDSTTVRNMFDTEEAKSGKKTKVPVHQSYNDWDCTNLFQATIFAWSFALPASTGSYNTLSDLYVRSRAVPHGSFHASVVSLGGNTAETFALAIDQLRLLRNSLCHSTSSDMDKATFDQRVTYAKDAFQALGVPTAPIDAVRSLTELNFPTNEVRKLETGIRNETRAYIKFLEEINSDINELKALLNSIKQTNEEDTVNISILEQKVNALKEAQDQRDAKITQQYTAILEGVSSSILANNAVLKAQEGLKGVSSDISAMKKNVAEDTASKEDITRLEKKIVELKVGQDECDTQPKHSGVKPLFSRASLPPMVPNFTGRQSECEEIISHVTSEFTRLVSICGSPGFGKTSVAIAVGHELQSQGLPVFWLSLRGLRSKEELSSRFLSFLRRPNINSQPSDQGLLVDDEICQLFSEISDHSLFILDNADDLLESGCPKLKEDVTQFLEEILRQNPRITFVVATRESLKFMEIHFQGHQGLRIKKLDEVSAQSLVHDLLPNARAADCAQVSQICGQVPLAMKLMCSLISEDSASPRDFLGDFMTSCTENIFKMLDNQDYPSSHRLQFFFDSSFRRLTAQEQEALISLSILPENFSTEVAATVLGKKTPFEAKRMLQSLRRKSLIDSSSKPEEFKMHKLLQSFAREKGEKHMKETILNSKARLNAFYISLFKKLNEQFLTGQSMAAYIAFYEDKKSIIQSLVEGCSDFKTADNVFEILIKGELFLDSLFWSVSEGRNFDHIYDAAIKAATLHGKLEYQRQLLSSRPFSEVTWGRKGRTKQLLSNVDEIHATTSFVPNQERGKYLCYLGICYLAAAEMESGVQCIKKAVSSLDQCNNSEQTILKLVIFQILAVHCQSLNDFSGAGFFYDKALDQCTALGDWKLLLISPMESKRKEVTNDLQFEKESHVLLNQPLKFQCAFLVSEATKFFSDANTDQYISNLVFQVLEKVERAATIPLGLLIFQRAVAKLLWNLNNEDPVKLYLSRINYHQKALKQSDCSQIQTKALATYYLDLGRVYLEKLNYSEALQSNQRALDITTKCNGEEDESTADCYHSLGMTQCRMNDLASALTSLQRALAIRLKLLGEEHASTADSYTKVAVVQNKMYDHKSALQSHQRALAINLKLFGEEHKNTSDSYFSLGVTHFHVRDFTSALQSHQHALAIRLKLFGEENERTSESYYFLGITQFEMGDFTSALQSHQHALAIRLKLFGEERERTSNSYYSLGITQYEMGDFSSALQSHQQALAIRLKLFGEHESVADIYHSLEILQRNMLDYNAALQSHRREIAIRTKLFGEGHASTADSYYSLGITQLDMNDFKSALQSHQRALANRISLFGEKHASTADSYYSIGIIHHMTGDLSSALQSKQRALDIRIQLFGDEHVSIADSYYSLGITQHDMDDFISALESHRRALAIRRRLFGEEHEETCDSYRKLEITQQAQREDEERKIKQKTDIGTDLSGKEH